MKRKELLDRAARLRPVLHITSNHEYGFARLGFEFQEGTGLLPEPFDRLSVYAQLNRRGDTVVGEWYGYSLGVTARCDIVSLDEFERARPALRDVERALEKHRSTYGYESLRGLGAWLVVVLLRLGFHDCKVVNHSRRTAADRHETIVSLAALPGHVKWLGEELAEKPREEAEAS